MDKEEQKTDLDENDSVETIDIRIITGSRRQADSECHVIDATVPVGMEFSKFRIALKKKGGIENLGRVYFGKAADAFNGSFDKSHKFDSDNAKSTQFYASNIKSLKKDLKINLCSVDKPDSVNANLIKTGKEEINEDLYDNEEKNQEQNVNLNVSLWSHICQQISELYGTHNVKNYSIPSDIKESQNYDNFKNTVEKKKVLIKKKKALINSLPRIGLFSRFLSACSFVLFGGIAVLGVPLVAGLIILDTLFKIFPFVLMVAAGILLLLVAFMTFWEAKSLFGKCASWDKWILLLIAIGVLFLAVILKFFPSLIISPALSPSVSIILWSFLGFASVVFVTCLYRLFVRKRYRVLSGVSAIFSFSTMVISALMLSGIVPVPSINYHTLFLAIFPVLFSLVVFSLTWFIYYTTELDLLDVVKDGLIKLIYRSNDYVIKQGLMEEEYELENILNGQNQTLSLKNLISQVSDASVKSELSLGILDVAGNKNPVTRLQEGNILKFNDGQQYYFLKKTIRKKLILGERADKPLELYCLDSEKLFEHLDLKKIESSSGSDELVFEVDDQTPIKKIESFNN